MQHLTWHAVYNPTLRLRTPNEWESLVHWQDVLVWRNQIYNIVINSFGSMTHLAANLHQLGYKVRGCKGPRRAGRRQHLPCGATFHRGLAVHPLPDCYGTPLLPFAPFASCNS